MRNKASKYFISVAALLALLSFYAFEPAPRHTSEISISDQRAQHILYGDEHGGGHKHGVGKPCKSEFPADWNDAEILDVTKRVAANDNLNWMQGRNDYYMAEETIEGMKVRVVLGPQKRNVITAYPTNVPRNPCPANDR